MDREEFARLRKAIYRSFASQPHKIKTWLALLEQYAKPERKQPASAPSSAKPSGAASSKIDAQDPASVSATGQPLA
jgi:hypothetical protein